jgi:hypothetical protein
MSKKGKYLLDSQPKVKETKPPVARPGITLLLNKKVNTVRSSLPLLPGLSLPFYVRLFVD